MIFLFLIRSTNQTVHNTDHPSSGQQMLIKRTPCTSSADFSPETHGRKKLFQLSLKFQAAAELQASVAPPSLKKESYFSLISRTHTGLACSERFSAHCHNSFAARNRAEVSAASSAWPFCVTYSVVSVPRSPRGKERRPR